MRKPRGEEGTRSLHNLEWETDAHAALSAAEF